MLLFTGACGYIGSSVARYFLEYTAYKIWIVDNLSTGFAIHAEILKKLYPDRVYFDQIDLKESAKLEFALQEKEAQGYQIIGVLHFAAKILVEESTHKPLEYYENNTLNTLKLAQLCLQHNIKYFLFSSSAATYKASTEPVSENAPLDPLNPYGASKMMSERMLLDISLASALKCVILRYFNVAGAIHFNDYKNALALGQRTQNATHLIKIACECAVGKHLSMAIFGSDYPTPDGTCIRDYIHIDDLALAHLEAFKTLLEKQTSEVYNVGYGRGYSVAEVINKVKEISGVNFLVRKQGRRAGDPSSLIANPHKILAQTAFKPRFCSLDLIVQSAYEWEKYLSKC